MSILVFYVLSIILIWCNILVYMKHERLKFKGWEPTLTESMFKYSVFTLNFIFSFYAIKLLGGL